MGTLPSGTVTFLFTDIEGSTSRWEHVPDAMRAALTRHDTLLRQAIEYAGGVVFKTMGDAFYAVFSEPSSALAAAVSAQRAILAESWDAQLGALRVRMGLHTGVPELRGGDYFGQPLNRVARLMAAGNGAQVLLSQALVEMVGTALPAGATLRDLGEHRLKDLLRPEHIYQLLLPDLPATFPPLKTLDAHPNNLPIPPTSLLGRERELGELAALLLRPEVRLVTLLGPGGLGKTRISLQVAADLSDDFPDGVYFVSLAPVTDAEQVLVTLAQTLAVRESAGQPLLDALSEMVRQKRMLLVLDNLEQVVEGAAPLVANLLATAPGLKLIATSRIVLHVRGEQSYPLAPLGLPDTHLRLTPAALASYPAIQLFVQRAQAARPSFELTESNAIAVRAICALVDGLPLAIELAAARVRLLTPQQMLDRMLPQHESGLAARLKLLTGGARDLPVRHQTLRDTIGWSYDLLDPPERALYRRLAVFVGGWTLEAAEAVAPAAGVLDLDALDGIGSLLDKSLIRQEQTAGGDSRFLMLQTIREFGLDQLASAGEDAASQRAHADFYLTVAEDGERGLAGAEQTTWLRRLEEDHDNLRAALAWARAHAETALGLALAGAMGRFWVTRGYLSEGHGWLEAFLLVPRPEGQPAAPLARALHRLGTIELDQGEYATGAQRFAEALRLYEHAGDTRGAALALNGLGGVARYQGDYERAASYFERSLALSREVGDPRAIAVRLMNLGQVVSRQGDFARATRLLEESLQLARQQRDGSAVAQVLETLGLVAFAQQDATRAGNLLRQSLAQAWDLGMRYEVAEVLNDLAQVCRAEGASGQAIQFLGAADVIYEELGAARPGDDQASYDRLVAELRAALGDAAFAAAWAEARVMSLEAIITSAIGAPIARGGDAAP